MYTVVIGFREKHNKKLPSLFSFFFLLLLQILVIVEVLFSNVVTIFTPLSLVPTKRSRKVRKFLFFFFSGLIPNLRETPCIFIWTVSFQHIFLPLSLNLEKRKNRISTQKYFHEVIKCSWALEVEAVWGRGQREGRMHVISGLSGSRNSEKLWFCTNMIYTILSDIISLFGRERAQSRWCPCQMLRKPGFSFKRKIFGVLDFLFRVNGWCLSKIGFEYYIKIVFCNSLISHSCMWLNSVISKACEKRHFYAIAVHSKSTDGAEGRQEQKRTRVLW